MTSYLVRDVDGNRYSITWTGGEVSSLRVITEGPAADATPALSRRADSKQVYVMYDRARNIARIGATGDLAATFAQTNCSPSHKFAIIKLALCASDADTAATELRDAVGGRIGDTDYAITSEHRLDEAWELHKPAKSAN